MNVIESVPKYLLQVHKTYIYSYYYCSVFILFQYLVHLNYRYLWIMRCPVDLIGLV